MKLTDLDKFRNFADLMGYIVSELHYNGEHIVFYSDFESKDIVTTLGYDYIEFLAIFDEEGNMTKGFNISHVSHHPEEFSHYQFIINHHLTIRHKFSEGDVVRLPLRYFQKLNDTEKEVIMIEKDKFKIHSNKLTIIPETRECYMGGILLFFEYQYAIKV
jgi:hypothetical protein